VYLVSAFWNAFWMTSTAGAGYDRPAGRATDFLAKHSDWFHLTDSGHGQSSIGLAQRGIEWLRKGKAKGKGATLVGGPRNMPGRRKCTQCGEAFETQFGGRNPRCDKCLRSERTCEQCHQPFATKFTGSDPVCPQCHFSSRGGGDASYKRKGASKR
jgi:hypothetical protein